MNMAYNNNDFDDIRPYKQGVAVVRKGDYYGAIMVGGKQILPPIYESLTDFENGYATAKYYGDERVVNLSGQVRVKNGEEQLFLPEEYDWGWDFEDGRCVVIREKKIGVIDKDLNVILPFEYILIQRICPQFFLCRIDGSMSECIINTSGNIVINLEHKELVTIIGSYFVCDSSSLGSSRIIDFSGKELLNSNFEGYFHEAQQINDHYLFVKLILHDQKGKICYLLRRNGDVVFEVRDDLKIMLDSNYIYCRSSFGSLYKIDNDANIYLLYANLDKKELSSDTDLVSLSNLEGMKVSAKYLNYRFRELSDDLLSVHDNKTNLFGLAEKDGTLIISPQYNSIAIWTGKAYIVSISKKDTQNNTHLVKYGIIDKDGTELLPFEYDSLDVLIPHKLLRYSIRDDKSYTKLYGLIDSNFIVICSPTYNKFETINTPDMVKATKGNLCGIIDVKGNVVIPIKFWSITKSQRTEAPFLVSRDQPSLYGNSGKTNLVNEKGEFVVSTKDGSDIKISSKRFDWCGNFSESGIAEVMLNGMVGKIDLTGHLITLNGNETLRIPDLFSWAYDFKYGYAAVLKESKWGIVDANFKLIIPCEYDYIAPLCPEYFVYKKEDSQKCGLLDANNKVIAPNEYASIENVDGKYFKLEVYNQYGNPKSGKFLLVDMNGKTLVSVPCSGYELLIIDERKYWKIYTGGWGIEGWGIEGWGIYSDGQMLISPIYKKITYEDGYFLCHYFYHYVNYNTNSKIFDTIPFRINIKGEIILNRQGREFTVPSEYDMAIEAGCGLIKVRSGGKWGLLDNKKKLVTTNQYSFIGDFIGHYAVVGVGKFSSPMCNKYDLRSLTNKMTFGLVDLTGEEVLKPEYQSVEIFDNGYICICNDWKFGLISHTLNIIVPPQYRSIKMIDNYHFVVDNTGLIDVNGNVVIQPDNNIYSNPYKIDVLADGFYKLTREHNGLYEASIVNSNGKVILPFEYNIKDLTMLENGLILVTKMLYNDAFPRYNLMSIQGKELFQVDYNELKNLENGLISIRGKDGWGLADILGNIIFEPRYIRELEFKDSVSEIQVQESEHTLECNIDGTIYVRNGDEKVALPSKYYWGTEFCSGLSIVRLKNSYRSMGVINICGDVVLLPKYESIQMFSNNIIITKQGDYYGAYDVNGNMVLPQIFLSIEFASNNTMLVKWNTNKAESWDNKGYVPGEKDSEYVNYDLDLNPRDQSRNRSALCALDGHSISDPNIPFVGKFVGYYARIYKEILVEDCIIKFKGVGVIDIEGNIILEPIFNAVRLFKDSSYAEIVLDKKIGIAYLSNHKIIMLNELNVKHIWEIDRLGRCLFSDKSCKYDSDTKEWYDGNYGVLNTGGVIVKAGKYDYVELLDNGLMLVCQNIEGANLYGILDIDGKEIIPTKYTNISSFYGENAVICIGGERSYGKINNGKWGVINSKGEFVKECVYDSEEDLKPFVDFDINSKDKNSINRNIPKVVLSDYIHDNIRSTDDYYYPYDYDDSFDNESSKYGGYNGYDDDTIDEAFDGNPGLTWNID